MRVLLLLLAALALAVPAGAEECFPTTSDPEVAVAGQYFDNDFCQPDCLFSIWWYFEANDIPGLQRSDVVKDDTCGGQIPSDAIVS